MKQCPACKTTYTDDSLRFCLADGTVLADVPDEQATVVSSRNEPVQAKRSGSPVLKFAMVMALIGVIVIGLAALAGTILYYNTSGRDKVSNASSPTPLPSVAATPDAEKQRLQDQLANIQKRLDEQTKNADTPPNPPDKPAGVVMARVNSPRDGFLSLRSEPDADHGERLAKIPHGSTVKIENCDRSSVKIGGRSGRWCLVTYGDHTGYVFDAWLDY
jgi:hypothetical protein